MSEKDFEEAHRYFTSVEFMENFLARPSEVIRHLRTNFSPSEVDKLREALGPKEKSKIARLLQALK